MKTYLIGGTAALALVSPAVAGEFEFRGAEFTKTGTFTQFTFVGFPDKFEWKTAALGGSVDFGLGGGAFTQFDFGLQGVIPEFVDGEDVAANVGTHVGFEISDMAAIGVFGGIDSWHRGLGTYTLGAEVAGETGNVSYEAYGAYNAVLPNAFSTFASYHVDALAAYKVTDAVSLGLGGHYASVNSGATMWQAKVQARYDFTDDLSVAAGYVYSDPTDIEVSHSVSLSLTKKIGRGTNFTQRNTVNLYNGARIFDF